jgi:hypothetical protein
MDYLKGLLAGDPYLTQYPTSGWVAIDLGGGKMSNKASFNVTCKNPDLAVTDITWTPYNKTNMNAPIPLGNIIIKYKNQGTGNSGPISMTLSCEGVPGTGPFGEPPICPSGIFPKSVSPVNLDLAAGQGNETGIISPSDTMPAAWGGGKYKLTAEAKLLSGDHEFDETNNKKVLEINVPWKPLTDILAMTVTGHNYKGVCSDKVNTIILDLKIMGNGYGTIKYQWIMNGTASTFVQEVVYRVDNSVKEAGAAVVIPLQDQTGWGSIKDRVYRVGLRFKPAR